MQDSYFNQYVSPNIVIVPTVSFCDPPTKTTRRNNKGNAVIKNTPQSNVVFGNTLEDLACVSAGINKGVNHDINNKINSDLHFISGNSNSTVPLESEDKSLAYTEPIVSVCPPNILLCGGSVEKTLYDDVDTSFSSTDCDKMVKKTLSWASNYLKSIGQSQTKKSKHKPTVPTQHNTYNNDDQNICIPLTKESINNTPTNSKQNINMETQKHHINKSKPTQPIKLNLLNDKTHSDKKQTKTTITNPTEGAMVKKKLAASTTSNTKKNVNTKASTSSIHLASNTQKPFANIVHRNEKVKTTVGSNNKKSSSSHTSNKTLARRKVRDGNQYRDKNKTIIKPKIQNKTTTKMYLESLKKISEQSKQTAEQKQPTKPLLERIIANNDLLGKRIRNYNIEKSKLSQNLDKRETAKLVGRTKSVTHIKSAVQMTRKFDLNFPSVHNKVDLRNKLKRKHIDCKKIKTKIENKDAASKSDDVKKQTASAENTSKPKQDTRKFKKIKLVINLQFKTCSGSSDSESDCNNNEHSVQTNVDSFLDDFNVDDIVECLSPEVKTSIDLKTREIHKPKNESSTITLTSASDATANNKIIKEEALDTTSLEKRCKNEQQYDENVSKLQSNDELPTDDIIEVPNCSFVTHDVIDLTTKEDKDEHLASNEKGVQCQSAINNVSEQQANTSPTGKPIEVEPDVITISNVQASIGEKKQDKCKNTNVESGEIKMCAEDSANKTIVDNTKKLNDEIQTNTKISNSKSEGNNTNISETVEQKLNKNDSPPKNINMMEPNLTNEVNEKYLLKLNFKMTQHFGVKFSITNLIRIGKFSRVFECQNLQGQKYALKVMHHKRTDGIPLPRILKTIRKDIPKRNFHCIYLVDSFTMKSIRCYLMEYYPQNLQIALADHGKCFHIDMIQNLSRQLMSALLVLRNNNICHLGIKPEHILLNNSKDRLKLIGFDEAQYLDRVPIIPNVGTVSYRPPEVILGYNNYTNVDVWAAGLVIYEMATNVKLFPGVYNNDILYKQQCTFGCIPYDMLEHSLHTNFHFNGNAFIRILNKQNKILIRNFNESNRLRSTIYKAYNRDWKNWRKAKERVEDERKLQLLLSLLHNMLALHPNYRQSIEFVYVDPFVYEYFDSTLWHCYE